MSAIYKLCLVSCESYVDDLGYIQVLLSVLQIKMNRHGGKIKESIDAHLDKINILELITLEVIN